MKIFTHFLKRLLSVGEWLTHMFLPKAKTCVRPFSRNVVLLTVLLVVVLSIPALSFAAGEPAVTPVYGAGSLTGNPWAWFDTGVSWVAEQAATIVANVLRPIIWLIYYFVGVIFVAVALVFEQAIHYGVTHNGLHDLLPAIVPVWQLVRDLANVFFIFMIVAIGVATILQIKSYGVRSMLAHLIIVALLVNFSFLITSAGIDISNAAATALYNIPIKAAVVELQGGGVATTDVGISNVLRQALGFDYLYTSAIDNGSHFAGTWIDLSAFVLILLITLGFIFATYVFLMMAGVFLIRIALLAFLLVTAPAAFVCSILPYTKKYFDEWLSLLLGQMMVAPLFFIFLYLIFKIAHVLPFLLQGARPQDGPILLVFSLILVLLYLATVFSKELAGRFGGALVGAVDTASKLAVGTAVLGGTAFAARQTLGRAALAAQDSEWMKNWEGRGGVTGWLGKKANQGVGRAATSRLDLREIPGAAKVGLGGYGTPNAGRGGYAGIRERNQKEYEARIKNLQKSNVLGEDTTVGKQMMHQVGLENTTRDLEREFNSATSAAGGTVTPAVKAAEAKLKKARESLQTYRDADEHKKADMIAEARGKERAVRYASQMQEGARPHTPGYSSYTPPTGAGIFEKATGYTKSYGPRTFGWTPAQRAAARQYMNNLAKSDREKALDTINAEFKKFETSSTP